MTSKLIHLVGSIPLPSAEAVFNMIGKYLGTSCPRVPDGETGIRRNWIGWQKQYFLNQEALEQCSDRERDYQLFPPYMIKRGRAVREVEFESLGFAENAILSFNTFKKKQNEGVLVPEARFLIAIPTPFAPIYSFLSYEAQELIFPLYEKAILSEVASIFENIPPDKVSIQWDVATEMSIFENVYPVTFENKWDTLTTRLVKLGNAIPRAAELGYHLCYGSMNNKHWKEPDDLSLCLRVLETLNTRVKRDINFVHVPVPLKRKDRAYFQPLENWEEKPTQDFFLGLIHLEDGIEGNVARIKSASSYLEKFGLSTECGMGRRDSKEIPNWMKLMSVLSQVEA